MFCLRNLLRSTTGTNVLSQRTINLSSYSTSHLALFYFCNTNNSSANFTKILADYQSAQDKSQFSNEKLTSVLKAYQSLGRLNKGKNLLEESANQFKAGLEAATKSKLLGSIEAGDLGNSLASIYIKQQKHKEARLTLDKAREAFRRHARTGILHGGFLENIYLRVLLLIEQKQASDAAELLEEYILRVEKIDKLEGGDFDVYLLYDKLGDIFRNGEEYEPAVENWKKGIQAIKEKHGTNSERLIPVYEKIAEALHIEAKYEEAASVTEESLKVCGKVYGENSIEVAKHHFLLGSIYYEKEDYPAALKSFEQCLKSQMVNSKEYVEEVIYTYLSIARIYDIKNQSEKSAEYLNKGLEYLKKNFGENSPQIVDYYLGWAGLIEGNPENEINYKDTLIKVAEAAKKCNYPDKSVISNVYLDLGEINYKEENIDQAIKYYEEGLQNALKEPKDQLAVEKAYNAIGLSLYKEENYNESANNFMKAIENCSNPLINQNLDMYYRNLGLALEGTGDEKEAVECFEKALEAALNRFGKDSKIVREYFEILVDRYARVERFEDIADLRDKIYPQ